MAIDDNQAGPSPLAVCLAGALSLAVAMGIGRFAFTPMLPLMIQGGQLDVAAGGWLAAANYAGYLLGAMTASRMRLARAAPRGRRAAADRRPHRGDGLAGTGLALAGPAAGSRHLQRLGLRRHQRLVPGRTCPPATPPWGGGLYAGVGAGIAAGRPVLPGRRSCAALQRPPCGCSLALLALLLLVPVAAVAAQPAA